MNSEGGPSRIVGAPKLRKAQNIVNWIITKSVIDQNLVFLPGAVRITWMHRAQSRTDVSGVVAALEEDILFGRIGPGARLIEDEIIERFQTKRHCVREAFRELEKLGVVSRSPNKGASVRSFSREEMEEIYAVRIMLAREAAVLVKFPVDPALIARLEQIHCEHQKNVKRMDFLAINRLNNEFHSLLLSLCGNRHLSHLIDHYAWITQAFRAIGIANPELLEKAQIEHQAMIDALRFSDANGLIRLCVQHMLPAKDAFFRARGWL
jgi:DNA-binding GntR family transcriptional regulator